jgi:hypothetical protein
MGKYFLINCSTILITLSIKIAKYAFHKIFARVEKIHLNVIYAIKNCTLKVSTGNRLGVTINFITLRLSSQNRIRQGMKAIKGAQKPHLSASIHHSAGNPMNNCP